MDFAKDAGVHLESAFWHQYRGGRSCVLRFGQHAFQKACGNTTKYLVHLQARMYYDSNL